MSMWRDHSVYITSLSEYVTWPFCVHYTFVLSMSRDPTVCPFHKTLKFDLSQLSENGKENVCSYIPVAPHYGVHLTMEYISVDPIFHSFLVHIRISLIYGCCPQGSYWTKGFYWLSWSHHFESFTVVTMTWLTVAEYMCHKRPRICSTCRKHFPVLSSLMTYRRICN